MNYSVYELTVKALQNCSLEELAAVCGVSSKTIATSWLLAEPMLNPTVRSKLVEAAGVPGVVAHVPPIVGNASAYMHVADVLAHKAEQLGRDKILKRIGFNATRFNMFIRANRPLVSRREVVNVSLATNLSYNYVCGASTLSEDHLTVEGEYTAFKQRARRDHTFFGLDQHKASTYAEQEERSLYLLSEFLNVRVSELREFEANDQASAPEGAVEVYNQVELFNQVSY